MSKMFADKHRVRKRKQTKRVLIGQTKKALIDQTGLSAGQQHSADGKNWGNKIIPRSFVG